MQDVICTLVMWLNTCVRFRRAECQLFNVQLQKCFADNETSPDFLSLKDRIFRAHFRASLNCEFVLFHIYFCSGSDCSLEWMIPALFFFGCRVFGDNIQGRDCGDGASRWLTDYLGTGQTFRLVHFEPQMKARLSVEIEPLFPRSEVHGLDFDNCCSSDYCIL